MTTVERAALSAPEDVGALAVDLRIAVMRTSRRLRTEGSGEAVSPGQYSVLAAIHPDPMTLRQLADREHVQAPSMTRIVNALELSALVTRSDHPTDRRQVLVNITAAGRAVLAEARTHRTAWLAERLAGMEPGERAVLTDAARILQQMSGK
ncbi:MarR family winged helix-turn-helix transcriptional regulator [Arthrobacter sp. H14-L1]|uniref:MarR family winged helix-turn-helix transcriptional regulator n=1 Tax=Arthrobacter sp. H14-L1 TaxID=2996697 RepID=UPI00226E1EE0|nr:MarR family transcriptional regulator [Arthrobacter sp. H14-L1]MCY0905605.1 MarR family transcriptional regulator [Arthrobacter sp. H14-L1]